ncbi:conserved unknown protein [Ectocarpus siliculosus]|uniref:Endonuclease/exonuclease/phosphatase domain-containing protein n=1 Tax=Ectocarpus siliculosus TaxID=2880 RepID=D7FQX0_ECTSI|nr:conserved unknown protein [Ectocarpus siliculosus]|eukprot:CBJ30680.1 conserved unknown protein [Ectocarpus siliculosus]
MDGQEQQANAVKVVVKIVVQNLEKKAGLATRLVEQYQPDILLAQELNRSSEEIDTVSNLSRLGFGTGIYSRAATITNVRRVTSPHAEIGGFVFKKTIVADCVGVQFASFHGYNGQPFRKIDNLIDHVNAVLSVLDSDRPCLFAGDFNTWSQAHIDATTSVLGDAGFVLACSWPYPGRDLPLDHAFVRGVQLESSFSYGCESDHNGAVLEISLP